MQRLSWGLCLTRLPHPPNESWLLGSALIARGDAHHRDLRATANLLGGIYAFRVVSWHVRACVPPGVLP